MLTPTGREILAVQSSPTSPLSAGLQGTRISLQDRQFDPPITVTPSSWGFPLGDT
jgi:hypothetical protein